MTELIPTPLGKMETKRKQTNNDIRNRQPAGGINLLSNWSPFFSIFVKRIGNTELHVP